MRIHPRAGVHPKLDPQPGRGGRRSTMERFEKLKSLGRGTQGSVILVRRKADGSNFVIKRIFTEETLDSTEEIMNEIRVLAVLAHPNIVGVCMHVTSTPLPLLYPFEKQSSFRQRKPGLCISLPLNLFPEGCAVRFGVVSGWNCCERDHTEVGFSWWWMGVVVNSCSSSGLQLAAVVAWGAYVWYLLWVVVAPASGYPARV